MHYFRLLLPASVLMSISAIAAEQSVSTNLKSVDPTKNTVSVDDLDLAVTKKTQITIDGKKASLSDLKAGQKVTIAYDDELDVAISISIGKQASKKAAAESEDGEVSLFDGKTLKGWHGDKSHWKVKNGVIVGTNTSKSTVGLYLTTDEKYKDFKLRLKFRLVDGNSGVQIRSIELPNSWLSGPQAEIFVHKYLGSLTAEGMKSQMLEETTDEIKKQLKKQVELDEWNEMTIVAEGEHIVITINGIETVNATSDDIALKGVIGLQLHPNRPTTVEFKDIFIKKIVSE